MSWKKVLATVAPTIATALGSPLAGTAVKFLAQGLLGEDATEKDLELALVNPSPEILAKIRDIESKFKVEMKRLDVDIEKIASQDRDSARQREIALKDKTPSFLSFIVVTGFFGVLYALFNYEFVGAQKDVLLVMLGALSACFKQVFDYYFGSSAGSKQKTAIMGTKSE